MKKIICLVLSAIVLNISINAQEIDCTVDIITEALSQEHIMNLETFSHRIMDYINSNKFSDVDWEGPKIPVSIQIQLVPIGMRNYSANMFITSKRTISEEKDEAVVNMRFEDMGKWNFEYSSGLSLSFDYNRYDNLSSILDFYMLIIIGLDLDTYQELDGDGCFRRAKNIFDLASAYNAPGWGMSTSDYGRYTLISDLSSPRLDGFRRLVLEYYIDGLELLEFDREEALANIASTINEMANFRERYITPSHYMEAWFFSKCTEFCDLFRGYSDRKVFRNLIYLDPTNTVRYEAARDSKR